MATLPANHDGQISEAPGGIARPNRQAGDPHDARDVNRRVLVVDDNESIHTDIHKILQVESPARETLIALETELFGGDPSPACCERYEIVSAYQGQQALERVQSSVHEQRPFAVAFVDVRMPPGWDGVETARRLWEVDPQLQLVLCTAYSDHSLDDLDATLSAGDRLLVLKKPFEAVEIRQLARALTHKWTISVDRRQRLADLEALVAERTARLEQVNRSLQEQLAQRHQMAETLRRAQKLEALGQLTAGVAHEINNPLSYVVMNIEHLRELVGENDAFLPPEVARSMHEVLHETGVGARRIKTIIKDVRLFGRQTTVVRREPVDVNAAARTAVRMLDNQIRHRALLAEALDGVPLVLGDAHHLEQVLVNLLVNACQALAEGDHGDGRIDVATRTVDGRVLISVSDNGPGMSPEVLEHVFDPFFTTKPVGVGTGLGLSVCHGIVENMDGEITIDSKPGAGTRVQLSLPVAEGPALQRPTQTSTQLRVVRPVDQRQSLRILVVDDEPAIGRALTRQLRGHQVTVCENGQQALELARHARFALVLCDLMMPTMDGIELWERLQGDGCATTADAMAFMTGGAFTPRAQRFIDECSNPCLSKPIEPDALAKLVAERRAAGSGD